MDRAKLYLDATNDVLLIKNNAHACLVRRRNTCRMEIPGVFTKRTLNLDSAKIARFSKISTAYSRSPPFTITLLYLHRSGPVAPRLNSSYKNFDHSAEFELEDAFRQRRELVDISHPSQRKSTVQHVIRSSDRCRCCLVTSELS